MPQSQFSQRASGLTAPDVTARPNLSCGTSQVAVGKGMTAPFADNPLRMSICLFFRALYTLMPSQIIRNKKPYIYTLKKAFGGMPRHLYSYNISYCMVRASACRWPPPGYKQLQEFNKDSRQMLLDLHSIYVKLRICCTFYTPGQRTLAVVVQQA
jgi:hypothetical protein